MHSSSPPLVLHVLPTSSIFFSLGHLSRGFVQVRGFLNIFVTSLFLGRGIFNPMPNPPSWRTTPCRLSANGS
jgi:hypothetical protein